MAVANARRVTEYGVRVTGKCCPSHRVGDNGDRERPATSSTNEEEWNCSFGLII